MSIISRVSLLSKLLEHADQDMAELVRALGCEVCGGPLYRTDYDRTPRGGPESILDRWMSRISFCCGRVGCRKRHTPPSVRFLGRKVYLGVYVVLVAAMMHGVNARRVDQLHAELGLDQRTLRRWRDWWLRNFVQSRFWRSARSRFSPVLDEGMMPFCLVKVFDADNSDGMLRMLKFLSPITTNSCTEVTAM